MNKDEILKRLPSDECKNCGGMGGTWKGDYGNTFVYCSRCPKGKELKKNGRLTKKDETEHTAGMISNVCKICLLEE